MTTSSRIRRNERERARKATRKAETVPFLRRMKQMLHFQRTGEWEADPEKLHWHHTDPSKKTRKIAHLTTRSDQRIAEELRYCEVLHEIEHLALHNVTALRTR